MDQRTADRVLSELAHLREMFSSKSKKALKMPDGIQVSFKVARSAGEKNGAILVCLISVLKSYCLKLGKWNKNR